MNAACGAPEGWFAALVAAWPHVLAGESAFLVVTALALLPGLALVVSEWFWGDTHELGGRAWAAALVPFTVSLAITAWIRVVEPVAEGCLLVPVPLVSWGFAASLVLALLTRFATRRARRRRKPLSPAPEAA